ncbi:MAG TPA: helix-turn-helix transcriptional regulator [Gemmataceae bacterium]|jgi:DNA-binding Xre family transcriptional regulator|nr:helix-turn-helix transcriptional regulator [Gemmataceae bacterium]
MLETLKRAVRDSGQTLYRISKDAGVPYPNLHRLMAGKRAVSMSTLDRLCSYLGLELTTRKEHR